MNTLEITHVIPTISSYAYKNIKTNNIGIIPEHLKGLYTVSAGVKSVTE